MKSIDSSKKLVTLALGFTGAFIFASQALAEEQSFTVKPFIFAEGVGKEFYVEKVRTAHIVAATGLSLEYKPTSKIKLPGGVRNYLSKKRPLTQ